MDRRIREDVKRYLSRVIASGGSRRKKYSRGMSLYELEGEGRRRRRRKRKSPRMSLSSASGLYAGRRRKRRVGVVRRRRKPSLLVAGRRRRRPSSLVAGRRRRRASGVRAGLRAYGRKPVNPWIQHVKQYARSHGMSYRDALMSPGVRRGYRGMGSRLRMKKKSYI